MPDAPTSFAYQWYSGGAPATGNGATTDAYTTVEADVGQELTCVVTGISASGSTPATSLPTAAVTVPGLYSADYSATY